MARNRPCPILTINPSRGLIDEMVVLLVQHLPPGLEVTLHALSQSEDGDYWEAFGHYISDSTGVVKVAEDVCVGGTYEGVEPMGLLWSMRPVPGSRTGLRLRKKNIHVPMVVHISVYRGHVSQGFKEQAALACAVTERWYMAPGVRRVEVTEGGLQGTLFLPPGPGPFPALVDLWGGGGGLFEYRSSLLASHGYVSLTLDYMTPRTSQGATTYVNQDYFEAAFSLLKAHPQVYGDRVAMLGLSFGNSVALGLAVHSPAIQPSCLVCVSGSHLMPFRGSLGTLLNDIYKNEHKTRYDEQKRVIWRDLLLPVPVDPSEKLDVGKIECPLLLIVGEDDQNWPAQESATDIKQLMEEAGNSHLLTVFSYPGAGHLIEPPYTPHIRSSNFRTATSKVEVLWGGETVLHARAQENAWQKTLHFLEEHLYRNIGPKVKPARETMLSADLISSI